MKLSGDVACYGTLLVVSCGNDALKEREMNVQALPMRRFIDHAGELVAPLPSWADIPLLTQFYRDMLVTRAYDNKAVALQRTGKLGTYPSHLGSEAFGVAVGHALLPSDVFIPYYRDMPAMWVRGIGMEKTCNIGAVMSVAATMLPPRANCATMICHFVCRSPHNAPMRLALRLH